MSLLNHFEKLIERNKDAKKRNVDSDYMDDICDNLNWFPDHESLPDEDLNIVDFDLIDIPDFFDEGITEPLDYVYDSLEFDDRIVPVDSVIKW